MIKKLKKLIWKWYRNLPSEENYNWPPVHKDSDLYDKDYETKIIKKQ